MHFASGPKSIDIISTWINRKIHNWFRIRFLISKCWSLIMWYAHWNETLLTVMDIRNDFEYISSVTQIPLAPKTNTIVSFNLCWTTTTKGKQKEQSQRLCIVRSCQVSRIDRNLYMRMTNTKKIWLKNNMQIDKKLANGIVRQRRSIWQQKLISLIDFLLEKVE